MSGWGISSHSQNNKDSGFAQLRIIQGEDLIELQTPLRQTDLADAIGLAGVHLYRLPIGLEKDGLIERKKCKIRLLDERKPNRIAQFNNRFAEIDTGWFPPG